MLDIKFVRENPELIKKDLTRRKDEEKKPRVDEVLELDLNYRKMLMEEEQLRYKRNTATQEINELKKQGGDISEKIKEIKEIPKKIEEIELEKNRIKEKIDNILMRLPNILHETVPEGNSPDDNTVIKKWGEIKKGSFQKSHVDVLEALNLCDFERAAKISGARFYFLKNQLVLLDLAIQKFALDILFKKGYQMIYPPFMMRKEPYEGVTDLKDFEDVMYKIDGDDLYLIATSEHPIGGMHMGETFLEEQLPIKYAGLSTCFRKEAGAHGKDTKGIFRVHQFNKIEQFIFCKPEDSWKFHEELLANAEEIWQALEIPYRVVNICTADIGTVAAKKYDIEAWMPVQNTYREVVSCSNCTAYQATRLNIKYRTTDENKYVHTLNSTAVATGRAMVAILENFQQKNGSVKIPKALWKYAGFKKIDLIKK